MKKLFILIAALSILSCTKQQEPEISEIGKVLQGKHKLRKLKKTTEKGSSWSGTYFRDLNFHHS